jgi:ABC-2 type transport system ATP-binding protein
MDKDRAVIRADHLTRTFGARVAVEDLSLSVQRGEILALLGPNGAGKTTTLRMLAGLIAPTSGTVRVHGEVMDRSTAARLRGHIGLLTEAPGLWERLTVRENLLVYARLQGLDAPATRVERALDLFEIRDRARDLAAELSKGLKQRVALARTLLHNPDILLLDEPTSGLDPESARDVRELIVRLREDGRAVLLSTHHLDEVDRIATRVAVLSTRLIAADTPAALRGQLFGIRVRITITGEAQRYVSALERIGIRDVHVDEKVMSIDLSQMPVDTPAVVRALVGAGADIEAVTPEQPPLEDVYLRLLAERVAAQHEPRA